MEQIAQRKISYDELVLDMEVKGLKVSLSSIRKFLNSDNVSYETLKKIAKYTLSEDRKRRSI